MSFWDTFADLLTEDRTMRDDSGRRGRGAAPSISPEQVGAFGAEFGGYMVPGTAGLLAAGGLTMGGMKAQQQEPQGLLQPDS